jgi:hypothetical protein
MHWLGNDCSRKRKIIAAPEAKLFPVVPKIDWRATNQTGSDADAGIRFSTLCAICSMFRDKRPGFAPNWIVLGEGLAAGLWQLSSHHTVSRDPSAASLISLNVRAILSFY